MRAPGAVKDRGARMKRRLGCALPALDAIAHGVLSVALVHGNLCQAGHYDGNSHQAEEDNSSNQIAHKRYLP